MTMQPQALYLNVSDENFRMDSEEVRSARKAHWYAETDWGIAVLTYKDSETLLKHPQLIQGSAKWPSQHGVTDGSYHDWWKKTLLVLEGDEHHRIRRLVNPAFSRRRIEPLYPKFRALADSLIDDWIDKGEVEFTSHFAAPYATRILCMITGIDEDEWEKVHRLASIIGLGIGISVKENIARIDEAIEEITAYAHKLIRSRRDSPSNDILTALVEARDQDAGKLSDDELVNLIILLIFAGIDTTRHQLSLAMHAFAKQPTEWQKLGEDPDRYATRAAEEVLRLNPIGRWVSREASATIQHNDTVIEKGTTVHIFTLSSGTDPGEYDQPDRIDLDTDRSPHFAFGGGIHHCLGHFVARADLTVALAALSARITNVRIGADAEWLPDSGNTGASKLPIEFTPIADLEKL